MRKTKVGHPCNLEQKSLMIVSTPSGHCGAWDQVDFVLGTPRDFHEGGGVNDVRCQCRDSFAQAPGLSV